MRKIFYIVVALLCIGYESKSQSWVELGPHGNITSGTGRLYAVEFHPTLPDRVYVGGIGGAWVSDDGGNNFSLMNTDAQLIPVSTVGSIAVDQVNPNYIYMSTGTPFFNKGTATETNFADLATHMQVKTTGIYRSSNGGTTWQKINNGFPSGLTDGLSAYINSVVICPYDNQLVFALTSLGLFKTTNAQSATPTWTQVSMPAGDATMQAWLMYEPGSIASSYTLYVCNEKGVKSTSDLVNWTWITGSGPGQINITADPQYPASGIDISTYAMDIHPTQPSIKYVYAYIHATIQTGPTTYIGVDRSFLYQHNSGVWNKLYSGNSGNIAGPSARHNIVIDRNTPDRVMLAGIMMGYYTAQTPGVLRAIPYGTGSFHVDHRYMKISPHYSNRYMYSCNDGSLGKVDLQANFNSSSCLVNIDNRNLANGWLSDLSVAPDNASFYVIGLMDNQCWYNKNSNWQFITGGDGFTNHVVREDFYFYNNNRNNEFPYRYFQVADAFHNASGYDLPAIPNGEGQTHCFQHSSYNTLLTGVETVYIGSNNLHLYTYDATLKKLLYTRQLSNFTNNGTMIMGLAVFPLNPAIAYVARGKKFKEEWCGGSSTECIEVYKTSNLTAATPTWTRLMSVPGAPWVSIRDIEVSSIDPNVVFICYSDRGTGYKVKVSYDAGTTWSDYNNPGNLPEVFEIAYEPGTRDRLYASTASGIYYTSKDTTNWIPYNNNYPQGVISRRLYINESENKITAGTLGRGVWQNYLYCGPATNKTLSGAVIASRAWETRGTITSSHTITNSPGQVNVTYRAGDYVKFTPGFNATTNTYMRAYILPCGGTPIIPSTQLRVAEEYHGEEEEEEYENQFNELDNDADIKVFPNPSYGRVELEIEQPEQWKNIQIKVYSADGRSVDFKITTIEKNRHYEVDLTGNLPGQYMVSMTSGKKSITKRVIIVTGNSQGPVTK